LLFIFGYGVSLDLRRVPIAVVIEQTTPEAESLLASFSNSRYFEVRLALDRSVERRVFPVSKPHEHRVVHLELLPGAERRAGRSPGEVLLARAQRKQSEAEEREQSVSCAKHNHEDGKEFEVKGAGSSWSSDQCDSAPSVVQLVISSDGANSASTCRQIPQGAAGMDPSVAITSDVKRRSPSPIADSTAARSAQIVAPKDAFSTLQPVNVRPPTVASAAPTRKCE